MHDLYYQAMLYDMLNVQNDIIEDNFNDVSPPDPSKPKKLIFLTHEDEIYNKLRYIHIANVLETIPKVFKEFT